MNPKLIWAGILLAFDFMINPSLNLLSFVFIAMGIDFVTGVVKAKFKKEARTSEGYRRTVIKLFQSIVPILTLYIASKMIPERHEMLQRCSGFTMMFVIYIEVTSILENLYEIDKTSMLAKYLYRPALVILKFGIEKNPVANAADKVSQQKNQGHE